MAYKIAQMTVVDPGTYYGYSNACLELLKNECMATGFFSSATIGYTNTGDGVANYYKLSVANSEYGLELRVNTSQNGVGICNIYIYAFYGSTNINYYQKQLSTNHVAKIIYGASSFCIAVPGSSGDYTSGNYGGSLSFIKTDEGNVWCLSDASVYNASGVSTATLPFASSSNVTQVGSKLLIIPARFIASGQVLTERPNANLYMGGSTQYAIGSILSESSGDYYLVISSGFTGILLRGV